MDTLIITTLIIIALISILLKRRVLIEVFSCIASAIAFGGSVVIALEVSSTGVYSSWKFFSVDSLGAIIMLIIGLIGFVATVYSVVYLRQETAKKIIGFTRVKQNFILLDIFLAAMFLAVMANNPIVAWISVEATTLSTAFLISFYNNPSSVEGAWKYLIINSVGLLFGFFGTLLYFTTIKSTPGGFISWQTLMANAAHMDPLIAKVAFIFVLVGYGTKMGLVPMHTWLPDAHGKAPAPISALLSGVLLNVALVVILRFKVITDISTGPFLSNELLIIFGLLSLFLSASLMLSQKKYKRLLAYSSIENMGVIALGFGFGGIVVALPYIIYHALVKSALFLLSGNILLKYGSGKISKVKGALSVIPLTSVLFIFGFLVITGMPPFGIFISKIGILFIGMESHMFVSIAALLFMSLAFIGFLKFVMAMFFGEKLADVKTGENNIWLVIPPAFLLMIMVYLSFSIPPFLQTLMHNVYLYYSI